MVFDCDQCRYRIVWCENTRHWEYEETLNHAGIEFLAGIDVGGPSRLLDRSKLLPVADIGPEFQGAAMLPCAFSPRARDHLHRQAIDLGFVLSAALVDPTSIVAESAKIGTGCYVNAGVVIGGASGFGQLGLINRSVSIGHHCMVGNLASIGPGAVLASNVRIGDKTVIGAGATIMPDVRIGFGAVVAGGSVVRRDVPDGIVVAGHPARPMRVNPDRTSVVQNEQD